MTLALTPEHRDLAATVADLLGKREVRTSARALLEAPTEELPSWWSEVVGLGWLGLHLLEEHGGSGFGLEELAIVTELGRVIAPGPFVPTVVVSSVLAATGSVERLPALADGSLLGGFGLGGSLGGSLSVQDGRATGDAGPVLGGGQADLLLLVAGDDAVLVEPGDGVHVETPANLDPTRRSARVQLDGAPCTVLPGAAQVLRDLARVVLAAEAAGVAQACTAMAAGYARQRHQFGRPIGMFQAVKHHCADMAVAAESATCVAWDAARAAAVGGQATLTYAAAVAAATAGPAVDLCADLNTQVHGGIGMTWEHDAHLLVRRATVLRTLLDPDAAKAELVELTRRGVRRTVVVDLPPEAELIRAEARAFADRVAQLPAGEQQSELLESGYLLPHWPRPFGRDAGAVEQLVVEQVLGEAGIARPSFGITGWVILTLVQHGTADQVERWVRPALRREVEWCQLFSEPGAGSDAAGIRTRAVRTEGGWVVNGQKVWTTGAHKAAFGLATVRTDPDLPKHQGITTVALDMRAPGVTVRPLRQTNGQRDFNEVFLDDVFVPDADVVGEVNAGWTVARATLGNESVSIGSEQDAMSIPASMVVDAFDRQPRLTAEVVGAYVAHSRTIRLLNLRSAHRAVAGGGPGPEGAISKLLLSELSRESAFLLTGLAGPEALFLDGEGMVAGHMQLMRRALSIAGGTSEIKRNQIGERILGLPRDPLIS